MTLHSKDINDINKLSSIYPIPKKSADLKRAFPWHLDKDMIRIKEILFAATEDDFSNIDYGVHLKRLKKFYEVYCSNA